MPPIITYTTYDDVRAVLGVAIEEIPDNVISLKVYENTLTLALSSVSGALDPDTVVRNLTDHYDYLIALETPTAIQVKFIQTIEMYATYIVADQLANSISMSAPKTQADGKSVLVRFSSEATFKAVQKAIKNTLGKLSVAIMELLSVTVATAPHLTVVAPDVDLITGV